MVPQNFYQQRASHVIALMNRMLDEELEFTTKQKSQGILAGSGSSREIRFSMGSQHGSELIVRPAIVFGNMAGADLLRQLGPFDQEQRAAYDQILSHMAAQATNTFLGHVIKLIEPECRTLQDSCIMRNFALLTATHFVSPAILKPRL